MIRILMILTLCTIASGPMAQTELTPAKFDLLNKFNHCISNPQTANYQSCQKILDHSFTLRREIGNALQACLIKGSRDCAAHFDAAGLPADRLNITSLDHCTLLGNLERIDIAYMPENSCIETIATLIERDTIQTHHDTEISCSKTYVACIEAASMSAKYWQTAGWSQLHTQQQDIIAADEIALQTRYQHYSLLERRYQLRIDLAKTTCSLQTLGQQRNSARDIDVCLGQAYAAILVNRENDTDD